MHRMAGTYVLNAVTRHAMFARRSADQNPLSIVWKTCQIGCARIATGLSVLDAKRRSLGMLSTSTFCNNSALHGYATIATCVSVFVVERINQGMLSMRRFYVSDTKNGPVRTAVIQSVQNATTNDHGSWFHSRVRCMCVVIVTRVAYQIRICTKIIL